MLVNLRIFKFLCPASKESVLTLFFYWHRGIENLSLSYINGIDSAVILMVSY